MVEQKINLDEYVDGLPLAVAIHRSEIKSMLREFAKDLLELAAENVVPPYYADDKQYKRCVKSTINQIEY